jgi:hypothetical protein
LLVGRCLEKRMVDDISTKGLLGAAGVNPRTREPFMDGVGAYKDGSKRHHGIEPSNDGG